MYCLELIKFDVSNNNVEVENGALFRDVAQSWKILGFRGKLLKILGEKVGTRLFSKRVNNLVLAKGQ